MSTSIGPSIPLDDEEAKRRLKRLSRFEAEKADTKPFVRPKLAHPSAQARVKGGEDAIKRKLLEVVAAAQESGEDLTDFQLAKCAEFGIPIPARQPVVAAPVSSPLPSKAEKKPKKKKRATVSLEQSPPPVVHPAPSLAAAAAAASLPPPLTIRGLRKRISELEAAGDTSSLPQLHEALAALLTD